MPKPSLTPECYAGVRAFLPLPNVGTQLTGGSVGIRSSLLGEKICVSF
jgi:hypothetical protein